MKIIATGLKAAAMLSASVGLLTPVLAVTHEAADKSPDTVYFSTGGDVGDADAGSKDLDAKLADARARLEEAAHEVAELSSRMSGPLVDHMTAIYGQGPHRAVLGVQLDERSGKEGARIQEVSPGGAAAEAGLQVGDVITQINGTDMQGDHSARMVVKAMRSIDPDSKVKVRVTRDGKSRDFVVTARRGMTFLGMNEPPIPPLPPIPPIPPLSPGLHDGVGTFGPIIIHGPLGEMELVSLTPQLGRYFGTDKGVLVVRAPKDFKLEDGDVILTIDGREPTSGSHATRILASYQPGEKIAIKLMRQQRTVNVEATLPERGSRVGSRWTGPDGRESMGRRESDAAT